MSEWLPGLQGPVEEDPERTVYVDPTHGEKTHRSRWETRAAQWRAHELAEQVFGGEVTTRLTGRLPGASFRGLLHLAVPFRDLESHRTLEAAFLACAARDDLLASVPFVFVLSARDP